MNDFLPEKYDVPVKTGNYMKFADGENRLRILSSPVLGYEWWTDEMSEGKKIRKPNRVKMDGQVPIEFAETVKHFWAMKVYNYKEEKVQILEVTQSTIQKPLRALAKDEDWGSPLTYDIVVTKSGKDLETEYQVTPKPAKKLDEGIKEMCDNVPVNLNALYEGKDPFVVNKETIDPDEIPEDLGK
jgi:hypothetical protein